VCWACVIAAVLAGGRRADQVAAAAREAGLRHAHDLELEREVAARLARERDLESRLRREAEEAMRGELARLRTELAGIGQLRTELAALGELRVDLGRFRSELAEQLSGELLVERMVMRAQSVRGPAQAAGPGWDVDRWTAARVVPAEATDPAPLPVAPPPVPPAAPRPAARGAADGGARPRPPSPPEWPGDRPLRAADGPTGQIPVAADREPASRRHRRAAEPHVDQPPASSYDSSRYDEMLFGSLPATASTEEARSVESDAESSSWSTGSPAWPAGGSRYDAAGSPAAEPASPAVPASSGHARLEQILAESGVAAPSGGRSHRRRHRDEDDGTVQGDDVLARVLGRN
jgi:hypothetical protein